MVAKSKPIYLKELLIGFTPIIQQDELNEITFQTIQGTDLLFETEIQAMDFATNYIQINKKRPKTFSNYLFSKGKELMIKDIITSK